MQADCIVDPGESVLSIGILARQALRAAEEARERKRERIGKNGGGSSVLSVPDTKRVYTRT
jgi:hypothetical protein